MGDYMDPFTFLAIFATAAGDNGTGWFDPKYVALLDAANHETDPAKRMKMLEDAEAIFLKDLPIIPIYHYTTKHMVSPKLVGWEPNVLDYHLARDMSFK